MVLRKTVLDLLRKYKEAWINQDPDKIISIFTKNAIYSERAHKKPFRGHNQIRKYWEEKVVGEQTNIKFKLLNVYIDKNTAIAEWDANFFNKLKKKRIHIREIVLLEISKNKIKSLREYWHTK